MAGFIPVQSLNPPDNVPVAVTHRAYPGVSSAGQQHVLLYDAGSVGGFPVGARIFSGTNANALAVSLTDPTGTQLTVQSVHVANAVAVTGTTVASISGTPSVVASVIGQVTVAASIAGNVPVTQVTSPWVTFPSSTGQPQGTVVASVVGQVSVAASVAGTVTVQVASIVGGSLTVTGSVHVTQATSPWVTFPGSTGAHQGTVVASVIGQVAVQASVTGQLTVTASVAGTVPVSQVTSPWIVQVASIQGGGSTVTGSVHVTQATSPWITQIASIMGGGLTITGSVYATQVTSPWIVQVASTMGGGNTITGSVQVTQATSPWIVQVASTMGGGNTITGSVHATQATSPWIVQVASIMGGGLTVTGSVQVTQATSPWVVFQGSTGQPQGTVVASVIGVPTVQASVVGQLTVTASVSGTPTVVASARVEGLTAHDGSWLTLQPVAVGGYAHHPNSGAPTAVGSGDVVRALHDLEGRAYITGSVQATVVGSVSGTVVASVIGQPTVTASIAGNVPVTQVTSPWVMFAGSTGAHQGTVVASVVGQVTVQASVAGQLTVTASIAGNVPVTQVTSPWIVQVASIMGGGLTVTGSVYVTQATSPWVVFQGSTGAHQGTVVASVIGAPTVVASVIGQPTVQASVVGQLTVTASARIEGLTAHDAAWLALQPVGMGGYAFHPNSGAPVAVGSGDVVRALHDLEGRAYVVGSVQATVAGSVSGTVVASVVGQLTVTASLVGQPTVTASISGNVSVTQVTSPWVIFPGSTGAPQGTVVASVIGQPTVQASVVGQLTVTASIAGNVPVTQVTSPWIVQVASTQGGGSTITGSVHVTQATSPWIVQVASIMGSGLTITGSVFTTQVTSPWIVQVASTMGGGSTITGSVHATQATSPWVVFAGSTGAHQGTVVASVIGQVTAQASVVGQLTVTASVVGQPTVSVVGSVLTTPARAPMRFVPIAITVSSALPFPFDGTIARVASSVANGEFTFRVAADVDSRTILPGMLAYFVSSGQAMGQYRVVQGWTTSTSRSITVTSAFVTGALPASGQEYRFLLDTRNAGNLIVKTELSSNTNAVTLGLALFDYAVNLVGSVQPPVVIMDRALFVTNLARSHHVSQASYFLGVTQTVEPVGALGAKVDVLSLTGGDFCLWAATV